MGWDRAQDGSAEAATAGQAVFGFTQSARLRSIGIVAMGEEWAADGLLMIMRMNTKHIVVAWSV